MLNEPGKRRELLRLQRSGGVKMLSFLQTATDTYNEKIGEAIGMIAGVVILILIIVWLVKRSRKK